MEIPIVVMCKKCGSALEVFDTQAFKSATNIGLTIRIEPCTYCMKETHKDSFARGRFAAENGFVDKPE